MSMVLYIVIGVIALVVGVIAGKFLFAKNTQKQIEEASHQARKILGDAQSTAENLKKEKLLEAKEKFVQLKAEHEKEVLEKKPRLGMILIGVIKLTKFSVNTWYAGAMQFVVVVTVLALLDAIRAHVIMPLPDAVSFALRANAGHF